MAAAKRTDLNVAAILLMLLALVNHGAASSTKFQRNGQERFEDQDTATAVRDFNALCPQDWTGSLAVDECSKYIVCKNGTPLGAPIPCANGTFFHEVSQICEYFNPVLLQRSRCGNQLRGIASLNPQQRTKRDKG